MLRFQLNRPYLAVFLLLIFAVPAACGTFQLGVENGTPEAGLEGDEEEVTSQTPFLPVSGANNLNAQGALAGPVPVLTATAPAVAPTDISTVATEEPSAGLNCENFPVNLGQQVLPDLPDLDWTTMESETGTLYRLAGLTTPVVSATASPDGHWLAVKLARRFLEGGPVETALYILDTSGEGHWLASQGGMDEYHDFNWLPDGRLVWVDDGALIIGANTGVERRDLAAPEPVFEVWAAAQNVIFASGRMNLWRLNLNGGTWELVMGLEDVPRSGPSLISRPSANLSIAYDGTFAAANVEGRLYRIPIDSGYPARLVGTIEYGGRGGRIGAPQPLAGSPYWYPGEVPLAQSPDRPFSAALLDERNGRLVPLAELIHIQDRAVYAPVISPDGRWIAVPLSAPVEVAGETQAPGQAESLYLAPSTELSLGRVVPASMPAGWLGSPEGLFVLQHAEENTTLSSLLLPDGLIFPLFSSPDPFLTPLVAATSRMAFVSANHRTHAILSDGLQLASVEVFGASVLSALPPARGLFSGYTTQAIGGGQCSFTPTLFLWDIR